MENRITLETTPEDLYYLFKEIEEIAGLDLSKMIMTAVFFDNFVESSTSKEDYQKWVDHLKEVDKREEEKVNNFLNERK